MAFTFLSTGESLAKRALRSAARASGELKQLATLTGKTVNTDVIAGGPTADWRFDADKHIVRLGDRFHTQLDRGSRSMRVNDRKAMKLAATILRHERWHGLATVRDVNALGAECRANGVPFRVFNVLEDVRIEAKAVNVEAKSFDWRDFIAVRNAESPLHAILNMKICGRGHSYNAFWHGATPTELEDIASFYARAVAAVDSWEIVKLSIEWVKRWGGAAADAPERMVDGGMVHDDIGEERDALPPMPIPDAPSGERDLGMKVDPSGKVLTESGTPNTGAKQKHWLEYAGEPSSFDSTKADKLASKLGEMLVAATNASDRQTASSGSRLHVGNAASGSDQPFTTHTAKGGVPNVVMLMDMSGSMGHDFKAHAQGFIGAMLRLIRRGDIDGSVWLTGGNGHAFLPPQLNDKALSYLAAEEENESVADTLDAIKSRVVDADVVIIYTDGELTDRHVNAGAWRARGVDLVGAVVCTPSAAAYCSTKMIGHFGRAILGANGSDLANKLVAYIGNRTSAK